MHHTATTNYRSELAYSLYMFEKENLGTYAAGFYSKNTAPYFIREQHACLSRQRRAVSSKYTDYDDY